MQAINEEDFTGRTVDHYVISALIGGGAQGRVYQGRDELLHRDVAIKVLNSDCSIHANSRHGLLAEARALSSLNHPNVGGVYDFVTDHHRDFMVMEFIAGATLQEVLAGGPVPFPEVVRLGSQLARGLAAAHAVKIAHCDIKPANLKITSSGLLKIVDFGVATRLPAETLLESTQSTAHKIVGTLPYMAPEVLEGHRPDQRSDIFSVGAVLYEMATGCRAFPQSTLAELVHAIEVCDVIALSTVNPAVPVGLDHVVRRALKKSRSARYSSAADLAAALEELVSDSDAGRVAAPDVRARWSHLRLAIRDWLALVRPQTMYYR